MSAGTGRDRRPDTSEKVSGWPRTGQRPDTHVNGRGKQATNADKHYRCRNRTVVRGHHRTELLDNDRTNTPLFRGGVSGCPVSEVPLADEGRPMTRDDHYRTSAAA